MTEKNQQENLAETVAREAKKPFPIENDTPFVAIPEGWRLEDTEKSQLAPRRKRGKILVTDTDSFIGYIKRHGSLANSTIWCDANYTTGKVKFVSIINDHGDEERDPDWRDHLANFTPVFSEEWERWNRANREVFGQVEFATFIEENLKDIAHEENCPSGAQMLEMALSFEANQDMRFKSAIRLANGGIQMSFTQDDDSQTLAKMQMFDRFNIGLPVFWNGEAYQISARLRYRLHDGKLKFWFELIRQDKVLEDATKTLIEKIKAETGTPFFFGNPFAA